MKANDIYSKAINESFSVMNADIELLRKHRGKKFLIRDLKPYLDVVDALCAREGQEDAVFDLHKESVAQHYGILKDLTDTIEKRDEPYTEHIQGPALMEMLYERDPAFRRFVEKFIAQLAKSEPLLSVEAARKHSGYYGPVCVADFALTPGSTANVLNQILRKMRPSGKDKYYAEIVLASKSWGMNTSYVFGWRYVDAMEEGCKAEEAVKKEIEMLQRIFDSPMAAQAELMNEVGAFPFGIDKYQERYFKGMQKTVDAALEKEVNYANILSVPAYAAGDIGHHLCQSTYDMYKDDYALAMLEAVCEVVERTLRKGDDGYESLGQVLSTATGAAAAGVTYLLESEGYTSDIVIDLMIKRFTNFIHKYPHRGVGIEFHNVDFMDVVFRGNRIIHANGSKIGSIPVDYSPLEERKMIRDFRGCIYPNCAINHIFSTLMRFADHFCLLNIEPITMVMMTNILAKDPKNSMSPIKGCKRCAVSAVLPHRCQYCERTKAV